MSARKGFRQKAQGGRKERLGTLEQQIQSLEMASRISQMMIQQMMQSTRHAQEDLGRALGLLNEMQYKILAIQKVSGLDLAELNKVANTQRLKDFNEASDKEDVDGSFTVADVVEANSTVIITSTTGEVDRGIFRSRIELAKCGLPDLINGFVGAKVGAKVTTALNGVDHEFELLGIHTPPAPVVEAGSQPVEANVTSAASQSNGSNGAAPQAASPEVVGNA